MNKIPLEVGKGYVVDLPKEASVKTYTWAEFHELNEKLTASEKRYDALLLLARRLRSELVFAAKYPTSEGISVLADSAWLEE